MGNLFKLLVFTFLLSPMILSASLYKPQLILEPIIIHASAKSCAGNDKIEMHKIPGWGQTYHITPDCRAPSVRDTDIALHLFLNAWKEKFGDRNGVVESALRDMIIAWDREKRTATGYTEAGEYFEDHEVVGLTSNAGYIWVSLRPSRNKICNSSLVHELVHAAIWKIKETDGDPDHLGPIYEGWTPAHSEMIDDLDKKLCMLHL